MRVHLQGFGWIGTYLAMRLTREGIDFTWEDNDSPFTAWKASTGCIYPAGDNQTMEAYTYWWNHPLPASYQTTANFWYSTKAAPHGGQWKAQRDLGSIRLHGLPTMHINVQAFVEFQRAVHAEKRRAVQPEGSQLIVAHGFGNRMDHAVWGWSAKARLETDPIIGLGLSCVYLRPNRFETHYAYPVPGEAGWHYVGSSMIFQRKAASLSMTDKILRWEERFTHLARWFTPTVYRAYAQGWRPYGAKDDTRLVVRLNDGSLEIQPMRHSGVRLAPLLADAVLKELR